MKKIISFIVAIALLLPIIPSIGVSVEAATGDISVTHANIVYTQGGALPSFAVDYSSRYGSYAEAAASIKLEIYADKAMTEHLATLGAASENYFPTLPPSTVAFVYSGLSASRMGDELTVVATDGSVRSDPVTYSVLEYVLSYENSNMREELFSELLSDMLKYGASAQKYELSQNPSASFDYDLSKNYTLLKFKSGGLKRIVDDDTIRLHFDMSKYTGEKILIDNSNGTGKIDVSDFKYLCIDEKGNMYSSSTDNGSSLSFDSLTLATDTSAKYHQLHIGDITFGNSAVDARTEKGIALTHRTCATTIDLSDLSGAASDVFGGEGVITLNFEFSKFCSTLPSGADYNPYMGFDLKYVSVKSGETLLTQSLVSVNQSSKNTNYIKDLIGANTTGQIVNDKITIGVVLDKVNGTVSYYVNGRSVASDVEMPEELKNAFKNEDSGHLVLGFNSGVLYNMAVTEGNFYESNATHFYDSDKDRTCRICGASREIEVNYTEEYVKPTVKLSGATKSLTAKVSTTAGKVYYAKVYAYGEDANHKLTLSLKNGSTTVRSYSYFVSTQLTEVYLPFTATGEENTVEVSLADGGVFYVSTPTVEESPYEYNKTKSGTYLVMADDWSYNKVVAKDQNGLLNAPVGSGVDDVGQDRTLDCVVVGDYMYALCNGKLHTLKRNGDSFTWIGATQYYGELRQMELTSDKKGIVVVARNFGLYAFDISNPLEPKLASHIDSLEMASGLDIFGKYLYVADRTFGVDILDISDIYNPVFISNIPTGETQNVCYSNGYVYAGVWAECIVRVCDVRDVDAPKQVADIKLSGRGDGVYVKDGILYAATGQFPPDDSSPRTNPGYGLGNGLELWDVSTPSSPQRLSVIRSDGANYPGNPDLWRVSTAGDYVVFTNVYGGVLVYDIANPQAPTRVAQYVALSDTLLNGRWTDKYVFPHERGVALGANKKPYPVVSFTVDGDKIYFGTGDYNSGNNLYEAKLPLRLGSLDENDSNPKAQDTNYDGSYYDIDAEGMFGEGAIAYRSGSQIRAAAVKGNYLYLAAGSEGIIILDKTTMKKVGSVDSFDLTKDIQIYGDYLYTAEAAAGIAIYKINSTDPKSLELVSQTPILNMVQLQLSPDARYALVHTANTSALLDLRDMSEPKVHFKNASFNMVYQYQMSIGCIDNRYLMISSSKKQLQLYDFGPDGEYEVPTVYEWTDSSLGISGICADGEYVIMSSGKKVFRFDLDDHDHKTALGTQFSYVQYTDMSQCPVVIGDYLFVGLRYKGTFNILKLSEDRKTATTYKKLTLHANHGAVISDGERCYLPLGYGGIVSFELPEYTAK